MNIAETYNVHSFYGIKQFKIYAFAHASSTLTSHSRWKLRFNFKTNINTTALSHSILEFFNWLKDSRSENAQSSQRNRLDNNPELSLKWFLVYLLCNAPILELIFEIISSWKLRRIDHEATQLHVVFKAWFAHLFHQDSLGCLSAATVRRFQFYFFQLRNSVFIIRQQNCRVMVSCDLIIRAKKHFFSVLS